MLLRTLWRNGRSTTPFDSSASALFLSQRGCGGYFSTGSPGGSFPSCFAPQSVRRRVRGEGRNETGVVDPGFGNDEMKCETDPEGGAEEFLRGEVGHAARGEEHADDGADGGDGEADGEGADHPFAVRGDFAAANVHKSF